MKKLVFVFLLIAVVGMLSFGQISVRINPKTLPPQAPFKVLVDSDSNVSEVIATFNGTSCVAKSVPAVFTFYAPELPASSNITSLSTTLSVSVINKSGLKEEKDITIQVSAYAKPVIVMTPNMKVKKGAFKGKASFDVKVYGGFNVGEIDFYLNSTKEKEWVNSTPTSLLGIWEKTFVVDTSKMKNGPYIFSVGVKDVTGNTISSEILRYTLDNEKPLLKVSKMESCLPADKEVNFKVTALSTLSGIDVVEINGKKAERINGNTYALGLITPKKTGTWIVHIVARDNAGNMKLKNITIFVDASMPTLTVKNDAGYVEKGKNGLVLWKIATPLHISVEASAASQKCCDIDFKVNGIKGMKKSDTYFESVISTPGTYSFMASVRDPINGLEASTSLKFIFKIDDKAPNVENVKFYPYAEKNDENYKVIPPTSTLTVTITATDGTGVGVKNIGVYPIKAIGKGNVRTFSIAQLKEGKNNYPVNVKLSDMLGNSTSVTERFKIFVDGRAPVIKVKPHGLLYKGVYWNKNAPMLVDVYSETQSGISPLVTVKVNGEKKFNSVAASNYQPIEISLSKIGKNLLDISSLNPINGMSAKATCSYTIEFDNVPPTVEDVTLPATKGPNQKMIVKFKARDDGIGLKEILVNGKVAKRTNGDEYEVTLTTPSLKKSGKWPVNIVAYDMLGNEYPVSKSVYIDATAPHINLSIFPDNHYKDGIYWSKDVPFLIQVSARTDSGVSPTLKTTCNGLLLSQNATMIMKDGAYEVKITATNPINGKSSSVDKTYNLKFDKMLPVVSDVNFAHVVGPNQNLKIVASVEDKGIGIIKYVAVNNTIMKEIGKSGVYMATLKTPAYSKSSPFGINVIAVDVFGNKFTYSTTTFVDVNSPSVALYLENGKKKIKVQNDGIYFFKEKPEMYYTAITDGGVKPITKMYMDCEKEAVKNGSAISGTHFVEVVSTNTVNEKVLTFKRRFAVIVDNIAPQIKLQAPKVVDSISKANVNISVNDKYLKYAFLVVKLDKGQILYTKIFGKNGKYTESLRQLFNNINGENVEVLLSAEDMAGNVSQPEEEDMYVDTVPPFIKNVVANNGEPLVITLSESIKGNPKVILISQDGTEKLVSAMARAVEDKIYVYEFENNEKVKTNEVYKVEIENVTDGAGNSIGNNCSEWPF